jgi:hypothetical protein
VTGGASRCGGQHSRFTRLRRDHLERHRPTRESPGESRNLAVAVQALCFECVNALASFSVDHSRHERSEILRFQIVAPQMTVTSSKKVVPSRNAQTSQQLASSTLQNSSRNAIPSQKCFVWSQVDIKERRARRSQFRSLGEDLPRRSGRWGSRSCSIRFFPPAQASRFPLPLPLLLFKVNLWKESPSPGESGGDRAIATLTHKQDKWNQTSSCITMAK